MVLPQVGQVARHSVAVSMQEYSLMSTFAMVSGWEVRFEKATLTLLIHPYFSPVHTGPPTCSVTSPLGTLYPLLSLSASISDLGKDLLLVARAARHPVVMSAKKVD